MRKIINTMILIPNGLCTGIVWILLFVLTNDLSRGNSGAFGSVHLVRNTGVLELAQVEGLQVR